MNWLSNKLRLKNVSSTYGNAAVFVVTVLVISTLLSTVIGELVSPTSYRQGDVAAYTIRAPRDILIENALDTEERRAEAAAQVKRVFALNDQLQADIAAQLDTVFSVLQKTAAPASENEAVLSMDTEARGSFEVQFGLNLEGEEWSVILNPVNWIDLAESVKGIVEPIMRKGIIANSVPLQKALNSSPAILKNITDSVEREIKSLNDVYSLDEARDTVSSSMPTSAVRKGKAFLSTVRKLSAALLQPNVTFDARETEKRILQEREAVKPSYQRIKRGEVIVRQGDVLTITQERRLQQLREEVGTRSTVRNWFGYFFLTGLILLVVYGFTYYFWPNPRRSPSDLSLVSLTLVGSVVMIKVTSFIAATLGESLSYFDSDTFILATPVAAGGILLQVTVGASGVFMFMLSFALLTGLFLKNSWIVLMLIVVGNIVGAIAMRQCSRRSAFIAAGARIALSNMIIVLCFLLLFSDYSAAENASRVLWALVGGMASGILGGGFAPIAEFIGGYITDIKLLELASLDRPLLRELSVQAPGTWNHSMVIGQMGEAAAEQIGANGLLVRVGAYYHDIGKMKKPAYFVENQSGENRHDKLTPSMSALIIKAHVKDGIEMAKQHKLPQPILDFIPQHHGTSLISYFYTKALKDADPDDVVEESHYRYPGPRPQSKEAGILMVADAVEASSRTLSDPTPAKLQGLVQKIINRIFASGELEECDLTLRDLHKIAKTFTRVLNGIYHRRVEYSEPAEKVRDGKSTTGTMRIPAAGQVKGQGAEPAQSKSKSKPKPKPEKDAAPGNQEAAEQRATVGETDQPSGGQKKQGAEGKKNGNRNAGEEGAAKKAQGSGSEEADDEDNEETLKRLGM